MPSSQTTKKTADSFMASKKWHDRLTAPSFSMIITAALLLPGCCGIQTAQLSRYHVTRARYPHLQFDVPTGYEVSLVRGFRELLVSIGDGQGSYWVVLAKPKNPSSEHSCDISAYAHYAVSYLYELPLIDAEMIEASSTSVGGIRAWGETAAFTGPISPHRPGGQDDHRTVKEMRFFSVNDILFQISCEARKERYDNSERHRFSEFASTFMVGTEAGCNNERRSGIAAMDAVWLEY